MPNNLYIHARTKLVRYERPCSYGTGHPCSYGGTSYLNVVKGYELWSPNRSGPSVRAVWVPAAFATVFEPKLVPCIKGRKR
jgi:hypothetical protein